MRVICLLPENAGSFEHAVAEEQEVGVPATGDGARGREIKAESHQDAAAAYMVFERSRASIPGCLDEDR